MPVCSFVSSNPGVGKTTASIVLASQIASTGSDVIMVDTSPDRALSRWGDKKNHFGNVCVLAADSVDDVAEIIRSSDQKAETVIIDSDSAQTESKRLAVSLSDLVLVPTKNSIIDSYRAANSVKFIRQVSKTEKRNILYRVFFSIITARQHEMAFQDIFEQFHNANIPTLHSALLDYKTFRLILSPDPNSMEEEADDEGKAEENAGTFAHEVLNFWRKS